MGAMIKGLSFPFIISSSKHIIMLLAILLIAPWLAAAIPTFGSIVGSIGQSLFNRGDINKQNRYNSPINQVRRLREAGLPMASLTAGNSGNQSALPNNEGFAHAGKSIGEFISTSMQLAELDKLKADIRTANSEADLNEARRDFLLSGKGEDRAGTNLTQSLRTQQSIEQADLKGKHLANKILDIDSRYHEGFKVIEMQKTRTEIANLIQQYNLAGENIKGQVLENKIKAVMARYQEGMSHAQLEKLLKENELIDYTISGKRIENAINGIKYKIENATADSQIFEKHMHSSLSGLTYERVKEEFSNYKQYMQFVQIVQDEIKRTPWERLTHPKRTWEALVSMAYTTVTGLSGQSSGVQNILQGIK